jgi:phosphoribosylformimino-5-aminoimidazole carboxamide ribotide isomerase
VIAAPAVDLKGGRCVQLVGGRPDDVRVSLPDPVAQAVRWYERGFRTLHVVDLDAALGSGDNLDLILRIVETTPAETQVGGGHSRRGSRGRPPRGGRRPGRRRHASDR